MENGTAYLHETHLELAMKNLTPTTKILRSARRALPAGFTLVEIMVVMTILGMLAALVVPNLMNSAENARKHDAKVQISSLVSACEMYKLDTGKWPDSLPGLLSDSGVAGWDGPYLKGGKLPKDPWKQDFTYEVLNNKEVKITSTGSGAEISNFDTED